EASIQLLQARLRAGSTGPGTAPATQTVTEPGDANEAANKQRLAELLEREARGELGEAGRRLERIREALQEARIAGNRLRMAQLEDDKEYWERKLQYEDRRLRQADMEKRVALEKRVLAQYQNELNALNAVIADLPEERAGLSVEQRQRRAEQFLAKAEEHRRRAAETQARAESSAPND